MKLPFIFLVVFVLSVGFTQAQNIYMVTSPNSAILGKDNTLVGPNSGTAITTGNSNAFFGVGSGPNTTTGEGMSF